MTKIKPKGFSYWPEQAVELTPKQIVKAYTEQKLVGAWGDPESKVRFDSDVVSSGGYAYGSDAAAASQWGESGAGLLSMPVLVAQVVFPGFLPGASQAVGDCTVHDARNANVISYGCEIVDGKPDEVTGKIETAPKIPAKGLQQGAFSTEVTYWYRGFNSHGWTCYDSARIGMTKAGLVTRDNHPELGFDLTVYSKKNVEAYGKRAPSGKLAEGLKHNLVRQATTLENRKERRDFLSNGYALSSCGSEGFSNKRDANGVSRRKGEWAHAMCICGFDDRPETVSLYGESIELVQNSWGIWNAGSRAVRDSASYIPALCGVVQKVHGHAGANALKWLIAHDMVSADGKSILIPHGSFWAKSSDLDRRRVIAKSSVNGWPKRAVSLGFEGAV